MSLFEERFTKLLDRALEIKAKKMEEVHEAFDKNVTAEVVESIVKITDSVEKSIINQTKLRLQHEKNEIDKQVGGNYTNFLVQIHKEDVEKFKASQGNNSEEDIPLFESSGEELMEGETIGGTDVITSKVFKEENGLT